MPFLTGGALQFMHAKKPRAAHNAGHFRARRLMCQGFNGTQHHGRTASGLAKQSRRECEALRANRGLNWILRVVLR